MAPIRAAAALRGGQGVGLEKKKHRAKRRKGTYLELLGEGAEGPGPHPPPG